jgi:NifU-like protein involved in Fe-S cluster formation
MDVCTTQIIHQSNCSLSIAGADLMTFQCNGQRVNEDKLTKEQDRVNKHIRAVLNLTYAEVENRVNTYAGEDYKV